jgi:hypothetical protein
LVDIKPFELQSVNGGNQFEPVNGVERLYVLAIKPERRIHLISRGCSLG